MLDLPDTFLREIGVQSLLMSTFLGGISVSILGNLMVSDKNGKLIKVLIIGLSISSLSFILSILSSFELILILTEGYNEEVNSEMLTDNMRIVGRTTLIGLFSLISVISLSGWMKGKKLGIITTILGIITLLFISQIMKD